MNKQKWFIVSTVISVVALVGLVAGCAKAELPVINSFTASSTSVTQGDTTTLSWDTSGADTVTLMPVDQTLESSGSLVVTPEYSTCWELRAENGAGSVTKELTIVVNAPSTKTYTNDKYGFSFQYPADWVARPELVKARVVAAFGVAGSVPGAMIIVNDAAEPVTADLIVAMYKAFPDTSDAKVISDITPTTLLDGTPASQFNFSYTFGGQYPIDALGISVDKDGNRIWAIVYTIDSVSPYDEAMFSDIAHTLSVQ